MGEGERYSEREWGSERDTERDTTSEREGRERYRMRELQRERGRGREMQREREGRDIEGYDDRERGGTVGQTDRCTNEIRYTILSLQ